MVNEEIVGTDVDLNWVLNSEGDLSTVKGGDNLSQAIYLRLTAYFDTAQRKYAMDWAYTNYGSSTKDWLGKNQNLYTQNTLLDEIKRTVIKDPRIDDAEIRIVDWNSYSIGISILAYIVDGTTFQEYFIFSDLPKKNENINDPEWKNTWIDTRNDYYAKQGEYVTVQCYVRDKQNFIVPIGEVSLSIGGYHIDMEENPQEVAQSGTPSPGLCTFKFRIPPFIKLGTHKLKFKYKGIRGYNNCEGETELHILKKLPTYMEYKYPDVNQKWYYSNDYDDFTDPIVHVYDANRYDVDHGEVEYYLSNYLEDGSLIFIEFPIIFHGSQLIKDTVYLYVNHEIMDYSLKFIFKVDYMFRPLDIFEIVAQDGTHIDYLECRYQEKDGVGVYYLISTIASKPYVLETKNSDNSGRNKDIDTLRKPNSSITMEVVE